MQYSIEFESKWMKLSRTDRKTGLEVCMDSRTLDMYTKFGPFINFSQLKLLFRSSSEWTILETAI
jgi:hypothetical protein